MVRRLLGFAVFCLPLAAGPGSELTQAIRQLSLDRETCYRVRDLTLFKEDLRIYLADGYLIFSKPVAGQPLAAVFTGDVENGGGEVILRPPNLAERRSLASYTGSPNLDEHFHAGVFFFTGDLYQSLQQQLPENPANRKVPEIGALLEGRWNSALRNLAAGFDLRLALDLLNRAWRKPDYFVAIIGESGLGNFHIFYDPDNSDQIAAGQYATRDDRSYFDVWTHFPARSSRNGAPPQPASIVL
ncbi:MAG: hypothetical protein JO099_25295, partial [Acidobacteriia bacterium]|nr:hypothetical protein [Terriglobia bacterium]